MESRYLRKIGTTDIFIWTPLLAPRKDMEEISSDTAREIMTQGFQTKSPVLPVEVVKVVEEKPIEVKEEITEPDKIEEPAEVTETAMPVDNEKIDAIVEKICEKGYTKRPDVFEYYRSNGTKISRVERDMAWNKYIKQNSNKENTNTKEE